MPNNHIILNIVTHNQYQYNHNTNVIQMLYVYQVMLYVT